MKRGYRLFIASAADREFKKFPKRTREVVSKEISLLSEDPFAGERLSGPLNFLYSLHFTVFGKYFRAAYTVDVKEKKIIIQYVGPRGEFYNRLRRLFG